MLIGLSNLSKLAGVSQVGKKKIDKMTPEEAAALRKKIKNSNKSDLQKKVALSSIPELVSTSNVGPKEAEVIEKINKAEKRRVKNPATGKRGFIMKALRGVAEKSSVAKFKQERKKARSEDELDSAFIRKKKLVTERQKQKISSRFNPFAKLLLSRASTKKRDPSRDVRGRVLLSGRTGEAKSLLHRAVSDASRLVQQR